ncbi:MAG: HAD family hydrolase [Halanaerobiales bacterium]
MLITFDLDGVLVENAFGNYIFPEIKNILKDQYKNKFNVKNGKLEKKIWDKIMKQFQKKIDSNKAYEAYDWDLIVNDTAQKMDIPVNVDVKKLVRKYCSKEFLHLHQASHDLLNYLNKKENKLIIITNGYSKYQLPVLEYFKIISYFQKIITADRAKAVKPSKKIFNKAIGNSKNKWIHIGDSVLMDIFGAGRLDAKTLLIKRDLPDNLLKLSPRKRAKDKKAKKIMREMAERENRLHHISYTNKEIYSDYIISSLKEIRNIL